MNVIGLMSGTSVDAIDAALVQIEKRNEVLELSLRAFVMQPLDNGLRDEVRHLLPPHQGNTQAVCELNFALGEAFAQAAQAVAEKADVAVKDVDLIASHGQTIYHQAKSPRSTLQIANPAFIAQRTGCTVVSDFRSRDIALGGHGAPLVPWFDGLLFRHESLHRVLLNIGGMANLSYVPPKGDIIAFDTGPGNVLIDETVRLLTNGEKTFDENGALASQGQINEVLLQKWLAHPYFQAAPPKSTGRELFGPQEANTMINEGRACGLSEADFIATLTALTARSITDAIHFLPHADEIFVGGGGARNAFLMGQIQEQFRGSLHRTDELGLPSDAKEAIAFATMGYATLHGWPSNIPSSTGALQKAVLGSITPGDNFLDLMQQISAAPSVAPQRFVLL
ncbi:MAG TPA: anhydro-N-acetylmuramic acid kinase [Abditibacteriaceae bacterium]|jgi:anhydro-N-acetylmuramic acid kinase